MNAQHPRGDLVLRKGAHEYSFQNLKDPVLEEEPKGGLFGCSKQLNGQQEFCNLLVVAGSSAIVFGRGGSEMVVYEKGSFVVMLPALFVDNVGLDHCHLDLLRATSPISLFHSREQTLVLKDNVHKSQQPSLGTSAMFFHSLGNALSDSPQPLLYGPKDGNDFAPGGPPHLQRVVVHVLLLHLDDLLDKQQKLVAQRQGDLKVRLVGTGRLGDRDRPRESP
mmetsp:Transcript_18153/g.50538  ORF Transcript_18153/g.50538 Transcript_18153/m.50538 type:complete len:221 (-) Transcript_18153:3183-3845(-)